jgi:hypothetical protein
MCRSFSFFLLLQFFTSLQIIHANHNPIALHQLIQVEEGDELVIHLSGFDADEDEVRFL